MLKSIVYDHNTRRSPACLRWYLSILRCPLTGVASPTSLTPSSRCRQTLAQCSVSFNNSLTLRSRARPPGPPRWPAARCSCWWSASPAPGRRSSPGRAVNPASLLGTLCPGQRWATMSSDWVYFLSYLLKWTKLIHLFHLSTSYTLKLWASNSLGTSEPNYIRCITVIKPPASTSQTRAGKLPPNYPIKLELKQKQERGIISFEMND